MLRMTAPFAQGSHGLEAQLRRQPPLHKGAMMGGGDAVSPLSLPPLKHARMDESAPREFAGSASFRAR